MRVLHTIHLHGKLAEFGEEHRLCVSSPVDAVRALCALVPGFAESFKEGAYRLVRGKDPDNGLEFGKETMHFPIGLRGEDFHIIPAVAGAKSGGVGKIVLGTVLLGAGLIGGAIAGAGFINAAGASVIEFGYGLSSTAAFGITYGSIATLGGAIALAGVASLLAPSVKTNYAANESADQRASYFLGGQVNQATQGGPVVLSYGRCRVGSTVVSAGLASERI